MKLAVILLFFLVISIAQIAHSGMSEWSVEQANDDLSSCNRAVQEGISRLGATYKDIHFQCASGYLQKLLAPRESDIFAKDPEEFVKHNWRLFLPTAPTKSLDLRHQRQFDNKWQTGANQFYGNVEIWGALTFWRNPVRRLISSGVEEKEYGMLYVHLLDTSDWKLRTDKTLAPEKAEKAVHEFDKKSGIQVERYQSEHIPYIVESFCKGGPALVLRVNAWSHKGDAEQKREDLRIVPVNVATGEACAWN